MVRAMPMAVHFQPRLYTIDNRVSTVGIDKSERYALPDCRVSLVQAQFALDELNELYFFFFLTCIVGYVCVLGNSSECNGRHHIPKRDIPK